MERLHLLYNDTATTEEFKQFFIAVLEEETIKRVYAKQDVSGIADCRKLLDMVFDRLEAIYKPKIKKESICQSK